MALSRSRIPSVVMLIVGLVLGWALATLRPATVRAGGGGDRSGESIVATGPVMLRYDEGSKVQVPLDALYYLDYRGGRLLGTVPSLHSTVGSAHYIGAFAERNLVSDFKIDLDSGARPHFLMTTGALGTYNQGWAPLYVFETTTNQVAMYRIHQQTVGTTATARLELLELRSLARPAGADAPG
jgi:hypothetical protein